MGRLIGCLTPLLAALGRVQVVLPLGPELVDLQEGHDSQVGKGWRVV
jgi:hypothetical protein